MDRIENVAVLGSTGSIGRCTLEVIARHPQRYRACVLSANRDHEVMLEQVRRFAAPAVAMVEPSAARSLRRAAQRAGLSVTVREGAAALDELVAAPQVDTVMSAIVGAAGLQPILGAVAAGKKVLLANKEPLVMLGHEIVAAARRSGAVLVPVDSEHNAIFQCLPDPRLGVDAAAAGIRRIILTGSGGALRTVPLRELERVTPEQACRHPNWSMGRKVSVDSATMMNKGLEIIEASQLFGVPVGRIEVWVHPQSIVHSMVEYEDGSMLAQLAHPDMRVPIAHALGWPARVDSGVRPLDAAALSGLSFEAPDHERFPAPALAREVAVAGGSAPAILNAANEVAVQAFLERRIPITAIVPLIRDTLERVPGAARATLETVLEADRAARAAALAAIAAPGFGSGSGPGRRSVQPV